jgi:hypothetical protein
VANIGRTVNIGYVGHPASTVAPLEIYNGDGTPHILSSTERLLIDSLGGTVTSSTVNVKLVSTAGVAGSTIVASFNTTSGFFFAGGGGKAIPIGVTPWVHAGDSTATVTLSGVGRIVDGNTLGTLTIFKDLITPGGTL